MKVRTLIVSILGVLVVSSASLAQIAEAPEQEPQEPVFIQSDSPTPVQPEPLIVAQTPSPATPTPQAPRSRYRTAKPMETPPGVRSAPPSMIPTEVKILELRYARAVDMAAMISDVFRIQVHVDERLNRLIVNATKEQMKSIMSVIAEMDVPNSETSTSRDIQNLVYRIYMLEIPSGDEDLKPFSMILQVPPEVYTSLISDAAKDGELQISGFCLSDELDRNGKAEILIQGKAASRTVLNRIYDIPESRMKELKWDDAETFTNEISAAKFTKLPAEIQKHIAKFLGFDVRTVGYWFGNVSAPGEVQAPIGPWTLTLQLETESDRMLVLDVNVEMPGETHNFDRRLGRELNTEILSNTIRAKIGKPIIIGYNRESYGKRKMGAMVIIPEADPT